MLRPFIDMRMCQACQPCQARKVCKTRAIIKIDEDEPPYIAVERCTGCSACVLVCTFDAISMCQIGATVSGGCRGIKVA